MTPRNPLRIRTLTAGIELADATSLTTVERALDLLERSRDRFEAAGYEVQTLRIATNPFLAGLDAASRERALAALQALDRRIAERGVIASLGPLLTEDRDDEVLPAWVAELVRTTRALSFSIVIASSAGLHARAAVVAARAMQALSTAIAHGMGNFRFAAAANIPAGTPFFPVAWHEGSEALALGVESASLVEEAFEHRGGSEPTACLRMHMTQALQPIAMIGRALAESNGLRWLGIDSSPAPAKDRSIAAAIEALTGRPFGSASTLHACSVITAAIKSLDVKLCGYSGLMLPVLEDPLLAQRAGEGRYTLRDLLLYSSVCGTGLDVVPIPGDTSVEALSALLTDVAALSTRLGKALSARLFLVPGRTAGDIVHFDDPILTDSTILTVS